MGARTRFQSFSLPRTRVPHISRSLRDVGFRRTRLFDPLFKPRQLNSQAGDPDSRYPTSREKRVRYGHPSSWQGEFLKFSSHRPSKARRRSQSFMARLKSCPDTTNRIFPQPARPRARQTECCLASATATMALRTRSTKRNGAKSAVVRSRSNSLTG